MTILMGVHNTSNQSFGLNSFAGDLLANGIYIGDISSFDKIVINPNAETVLELNIRLSLIQIVNNIIAAIERNTFKETLTLDAYANVDNLQVPVDLVYEFGN